MDPYTILAVAERNQRAKQYMAKIISFNPYVNNSYNYKSGILTKIEDGMEAEYVDYKQKSNSFLNKLKNLFYKNKS